MQDFTVVNSNTKELRISLLGNVEIQVENTLISISYAKLQGLLAVLAMSAGLPLERDFLADLFWPEMTSENARKNLRRALYNLRIALGSTSDLLSTNKHSITLSQSNLYLDVIALRTADLITPPNEQDPAYFDLLEKKLRLYRNEFMKGVTLPDCPNFEDWLRLHRESLHQYALTLLEQLSNHHEQECNYSKALKFSLRYTELEPWNEDIQCKIMRLYALNDQDNAALQQYKKMSRLFKDELNIELKDETQHLAERISNGKIRHSINTDQLNNLISELYRCIDQPDQWLDVTSKIAATVGAEKFLFASRDKISLEMKGEFHWALGDDALDAYMAHYSNIDVLSQSLERAPKNIFHTSQDLYSEKKLLSSELYNDFCKPYGISHSIGVTFDDPGSTLYSQFACLWDKGEKKVSANDIEPLNILVPHLQQFVRLRQKFEHLQTQTRSSEQIVNQFSTAAFLCTANGQILARNTLAENMLCTSKVFTALDESILFYQQHYNDAFSKLLFQANSAVDGNGKIANGSWRVKDNDAVLEFNFFPFTYRPEGLLDSIQTCALVVVSDSVTPPLPSPI